MAYLQAHQIHRRPGWSGTCQIEAAQMACCNRSRYGLDQSWLSGGPTGRSTGMRVEKLWSVLYEANEVNRTAKRSARVNLVIGEYSSEPKQAAEQIG